MLGWPDYEPVVIPHPLQILSDELVHQRADGIVAEVAGKLLAEGKG